MKQFSPHETKKKIERAQKQFKQYMDWEGRFRESFDKDIRFANADSDNRWQWEADMLASRDTDGAPSMTINMTLIHCLLIQNEIKKNPPAITVRPTGMGATSKSAGIYGGLIREISRASDASAIYIKASEPLVQGGVGYWRVLTEYEDEESFNQVIRIRSVRNAMGVAMDPDAKEPSGADANWAMIFEDVKNDLLEDEYRADKAQVGTGNAVTGESNSWVLVDHTRIAEWYEREKFQDQLLEFYSDDRPVTQFLSEIPGEMREALLRDTRTQKRPVTRSKICWYKIIGDKIVDYREVPGKKYIPVVRVVGQETIIDGVLDRKGMVRNLKDPQRNMNFWVSAGAMQVALQTIVPWVGEIEAFENIPQWKDANRKRYSYLPHNGWDAENNRAIPAPTRPTPPVMASAYVSGIQIASQQFKDISGQHEATQGEPGDEKSGRAIIARKVQGDTATYHFPDALAAGVAHTGRIILDMAPEVYDTPRMIRISNEDMSQSDVKVDPQAKEAHQEIDKPDEENTKEVIFNPKIGRYEVEAEAGPDYATQRQWAVDAMSQIVGQNKELWSVVGDLLVENMDFPGAAPMAERLRRMIAPAILGEGPSPGEQKLSAQMEHANKLIQSLVETIAEKQRMLDNKDEELTIKAVDSETRRIKELGNAEENFEEAGLGGNIRTLMEETTGDALQEPDVAAQQQPEPPAEAPAMPEMAQ